MVVVSPFVPLKKEDGISPVFKLVKSLASTLFQAPVIVYLCQRYREKFAVRISGAVDGLQSMELKL